jgi:hypothetical protein
LPVPSSPNASKSRPRVPSPQARWFVSIKRARDQMTHHCPARPEVRQRAIEQATAYGERHREQLAEAQREWERQNQVRRMSQRRARRERGP